MEKEQPENLTGTSLDVSAENRARLKQLFPMVFTETKNDKGELAESIDFEKLKAELGTFSDLFESRRERYGMDWPGKKDALRLIQTPSYATLKPCREESVNFDTTENLFIEGDNLEVLKLLQKSYYGKVKMIYIDPPYNTGKEFIYPDNFSESLNTYLEYAGLIDGEGKKFSTNTANEGRFHTKWLNMMYPRLYLARNLLSDDGVIFISIDDNEVTNLRKLCDEIFGEENFVLEFAWRKTDNQANIGNVARVKEYIACYCKNSEFLRIFKMQLTERAKKEYRYSDSKGQFRRAILLDKTRGRHIYRIKTVSGKTLNGPWMIKENEFQELMKRNGVYWTSGGDEQPYGKIYLSDSEGQIANDFLGIDYGTNQEGSLEVEALFDERLFDFPKPVGLIKHFVTIGSSSSDIILDFFSGSATTAHAVLDLNKQDSGNRKFILVQLPEPCAEESEAFKAGYKTIADIGKERIRRVIRKLNEAEEGQLDFGDAKNQDRGFRVFKLDRSNFKQWQQLAPSTPPEQIAEQLSLHIDHISHKATPEDLLNEILLKAGFTPTEKIETKTIAGKKVFSVADGGLLLCLEDEVTKELIDAVAEAEPMQFICLDSAFHGNDQLKANAVQTFTARNMQKEKHNQIIFKTV